MQKEEKKLIRNIYIMLIAILCLTIISATAILSYVFVHWNDVKSNNIQNTEYDVSSFEEINYDKFINLYKDNNKSLIYIGRQTCIHCVNFVPILNKVQNEYNYKTYYLDISKITEEESKNIKNLNNFLKKNFGSTPMVIIVKDGSIIEKGNWIGEGNYKDFSKFIENAGYKKVIY